ncbi:hypothetical protein HBN50_00160 [Halobacteriovorax sp. GB3]|uniref:hypothetical protein n=1 Tax=Halobacteriovorax sp. GB3 TaxID=2719615 RepID=UPI002360660D|nr:hypothetical protein [Halobacteriovorax sp. GB3]MDD0851479.1 hypothetical protein [Halobacteriovorax sp. GB3]
MWWLIRTTFITLVLLLSSCSKHSDVEITKDYIRIKPDKVDLHKLLIVPWNVGPEREQLVSKGVRVSLKFPALDLESMEAIISRFEADSWLVRVRRASLASSVVVGQVYIPIAIPGRHSSSKYRRLQLENGVISIYFSASAISKRFANFPCPAIDHNRLIEDVAIDRIYEQDSFFVSVAEVQRIQGKVIDFGYDSTILNGGNSLIGDYTFELALYNSRDKRKVSNFVKVPEVLKVKNESQVNIQGCEDFEIPIQKNEGDKWDSFKWKR